MLSNTSLEQGIIKSYTDDLCNTFNGVDGKIIRLKKVIITTMVMLSSNHDQYKITYKPMWPNEQKTAGCIMY
jgi:hypothetical protein